VKFSISIDTEGDGSEELPSAIVQRLTLKEGDTLLLRYDSLWEIDQVFELVQYLSNWLHCEVVSIPSALTLEVQEEA
jgi:hypothetical protein